MRSNYVRSFYLPEHQPMPSSYTLQYQSRSRPHCNQSKSCKCGRDKDRDELSCDVCLSSIEVVTSANKRELTHSLLFALKPVVCKQCNTRFADNVLLSSHLKFCNVTGLTSSKIKPGTMTVPTWKKPCVREDWVLNVLKVFSLGKVIIFFRIINPVKRLLFLTFLSYVFFLA